MNKYIVHPQFDEIHYLRESNLPSKETCSVSGFPGAAFPVPVCWTPCPTADTAPPKDG